MLASRARERTTVSLTVCVLHERDERVASRSHPQKSTAGTDRNMALAGLAPVAAVKHSMSRPDREGHIARCILLLRADTSLPPGIPGTPKGEILLQFRWTDAPRKNPCSLLGSQQAAVTWWGQRSPSKVIDLQAAADTGLVYSITCGPKAFSRYLKDMQQLKIEYVVHANSIKASIMTDTDVSKLDLSKSTTCRTPIAAADGRLLGTAVVSISISYSHLVSSFELNEHLASVDCNMPLFPTQQRVLTPLRQLNLQSDSNIQPPLPARQHYISTC